MVLNSEKKIINNTQKEQWYFENQLQGFGLSMKIKSRLHKSKSPFQEIEVFDTYDYGILLTLDGLVMLTQRDEFYYHEILAHPALYAHPAPKDVLIIGGGDCGTLREVLKHSSVENAHLCEIDKQVVDISKKYFDFTNDALNNEKSKLFIEDGFNFLKKNISKYDVILVDSTDPIGEAAKLFGQEFFSLCYNALKPDGIIAGQCGCFMYDTKEPKSVYNSLKLLFNNVSIYTGITPTYPTGTWSFYYASKKYDLINNFNEKRYNTENIELKYYNKNIHKSLSAIPEFLKKDIYGE